MDTRQIFIKGHKLSGKEKDANQKLSEVALNNFKLNQLLLGRPLLSPTPVFCSLNDLGRQIYRSNIPTSVNDLLGHDKLLTISNGKLLSIQDPDPDQSNFRIYYSLNDLLNGSSKLNVSSGVLNYINAQANLAADYQNAKHSQFTAIIGTFNSYFNEAFSRFKRGSIADNDVDLFMDLYSLYADRTLGIAERNYVIGSIDALAISISDNNKFGSKIDFSAGLEASGSLPWARAHAMANYNWGREVQNGVNNNAFEVYLLATPSSIGIPSWDQLRQAWNNSQSETDKYHVEISNQIIFLGNEPRTATIVFGPFSDSNLVKSIQINIPEFMKSQKNMPISKDPEIIDRKFIPEKNLVKIVVSFEPNDDWINQQKTPTVSNSAQITLQFGEDRFQLQRTYPLSFIASVMARPKTVATVNNPVIANKNRDYSWSFPIYFDNPPPNIFPGNLYDGPLVYGEARIQQLMYASGLEPNITISNDPTVLGNFRAVVNMTLPIDKLKNTDNFLRVSLPIVIKYGNAYSLSLRRQVDVSLAGILPSPPNDSTFKTVNSVSAILDVLKDDVTIDGLKATDFRNNFSVGNDSTKNSMSKKLLEVLAIPAQSGQYKIPLNLVKTN